MRRLAILASLLMAVSTIAPATFAADADPSADPSVDPPAGPSATLEVPPGAVPAGATVSIVLRDADELPADTFSVPWGGPYYEIVPVETAFAVPVTVASQIDFIDLGILDFDPSVHGYAIAPMFTRDPAGTWSWLDDLSVTTSPGSAAYTVRGSTNHGGPVFGVAGADLLVSTAASSDVAIGGSFHVDAGISALPDSEALIVGSVATTSDPTIAAAEGSASDGQVARLSLGCRAQGSVEYAITFTVSATRIGSIGELTGLGPVDVDIVHTGAFACVPPCEADAEPNDDPASAMSIDGSFCVAGTLPSGDQDLMVWELTADDAAGPQTITLVGVPGTETLLELFRVTSAPGAPVVVDPRPILEASSQPGDREPLVLPQVFLRPGRYVAAVARSALLDGGEPDVLEYGLRIERAERIDAIVDVEPNDEAEDANAVADAFSILGDRTGDRDDRFVWTIADGPARWDLAVDAVASETAWVDLRTVDGALIASASAETRSTLYDLNLGPGTYLIGVREAGEGQQPYRLRAVLSPEAGDPEPNDSTDTAIPIGDGGLVRGRLAASGDADRYVLTVPPGDVQLRDVRLISGSGQDRTLCLLDSDDRRLACQQGAATVSLPALALAPGRHTVEVSGLPDPDEPYALRVDPVGSGAPTFEAEPNDELEQSTRVDLAAGIRGRGGVADDDHFRLSPTGEPQLWEVAVIGSGIRQVDLERPDGTVVAQADVTADGTSARLTDVYLIPGDHWLRVRADGPEYAVTTTALGPPDPTAEREPNDREGLAERYRIGDERTGRLPTATDRDLWRFTLAAPQPVHISAVPPSDGSLAARVISGDVELTRVAGTSPGSMLELDLWLEPGDHFLELVPLTPSEGTYRLASERLDPFAPVVDREPNDDLARASRVPDERTWRGTAQGGDDRDVFRLPDDAPSDELTISVEGDADLRLEHVPDGVRFADRLDLDPRDDGSFVAADVPAGGALFLSVTPRSAYRISLDGADAARLPPAGPPPSVEISTSTAAVAAYWADEQVLDAIVQLVNLGPDDRTLALDAVTSDRRWTASFEEARVSVPAGATLEVPATVRIAADAWADEPVRISVRATTEDGAWATGATELVATREAAPLMTRSGWSLPESLLGGLNVASLAFGAEPGGTLDAERERQLFDGVTPAGGGLSIFLSDHVELLPIEMEVDLAGDEPVPIAGTIINPQASDGHLDEQPRAFELLLSDDGVSWEPVLTGSLSPLPVDQAFVLDTPRAARHARLRIDSLQAPGPILSIGEWKLVAPPGVAIEADPIDLADPALGGHVVDLLPFDGDLETASSVLDPGTERVALDVDAGRGVSLVLGFKDGRAAQVTSLTWQDPDGTREDERLAELLVFTSRAGPAGPWTFLERWPLERDSTGAVAPLALPASPWTRYVRLTGEVPFGAESAELPARVGVIERATDTEYRSILGEWGHREQRGPLEWLEPSPAAAWDAVADASDSRDAATPLPPATEVRDRVAFGADEDWYAIEVPATHDTIELTLAADPVTGVRPRLLDVTGGEMPMEQRFTDADSVRYEARVTPGARYHLRLDQPPFSVAFVFDTSTSLDSFRDVVTAGLRSFLGDVQRGREAVTLLPFEEPPLLEGWQDDPYVLQDAFGRYVRESNGSSGAEAAIIDGARLLGDREGARAILLITDAETTTIEKTPELWQALAAFRPVIFSVHVGGVEEPVASLQRMQTWAAAGGGRYAYPSTVGEFSRSFDRMATWLRRPAPYALEMRTLQTLPATLAVAEDDAGGGEGGPLPLAADVGIEIILDTSASMRQKLGQKRRIEIAKAALRGLLRDEIAEGVPVAIRTFGGPGSGRTARCGSSLSMPLQPLDRDRALNGVKRFKAVKGVRTPIAAALTEVAANLASVDGLRRVLLITDGEETCDGDPAASIEALVDAGIDVRVDIVGFALEDEAVKAEMAGWAEIGGGIFLDARDAKQLARTVRDALAAPFQVFGEDGELAATGTVGSAGVDLDPGLYRVEVLTDPPATFDRVELGSGDELTLRIEPPGG